MLTSLHTEIAHTIAGRSAAAIRNKADDADLGGRPAYGYEALLGPLDISSSCTASARQRATRARLALSENSRDSGRNIPHGVSTSVVKALGLLDEGCTSIVRQRLEVLDESDARLQHLDGAADWLVELAPDSSPGATYHSALAVSGLRPFSVPPLIDQEALVGLALNRRAHMALSFLATVDLEMAYRDTINPLAMTWTPLPGFIALLAVPESTQRERFTPKDPIARLVDLIGGAGQRARAGIWSSSAPSIVKMGIRAELSGVVEGDGSRFIQAIRSGKHPMTLSTFRKLIRSQFWSEEINDVSIDRAAKLLEPYLLAAHMLTLIMPAHTVVRGHLDRLGWRDAYLEWWSRHAEPYEALRRSRCSAWPAWITGD